MQERVSVRLNPENLIDGFILAQPKGKRSKFLREAVRVYIQTLSIKQEGEETKTKKGKKGRKKNRGN